jgi:hypothetical protein
LGDDDGYLNWVHTSLIRAKTLFPSISMKPLHQMGCNGWWYLHVTHPHWTQKDFLSQGGSSTRQKNGRDWCYQVKCQGK